VESGFFGSQTISATREASSEAAQLKPDAHFRFGKVEIPQSAFIAALKMGDG
jgi:hypothetical protein